MCLWAAPNASAGVTFANVGDGLYNTGHVVNVSGNIFADAHWQQNPGTSNWLTSGATPATIVTTNVPATWAGNTQLSTWVQPCAEGTSPVNWPVGGYWFTTRFFLSDQMDPNNTKITFQVASDDEIVRMRINVDEMLVGSPAFPAAMATGAWSPDITLSSEFAPGWNTLAFLVHNTSYGHTGFRFELTYAGPLEPTPVPEPMSLVVFAGLAVVGTCGHFRNRVRKLGTM
jgi:hypothetical protein